MSLQSLCSDARLLRIDPTVSYDVQMSVLVHGRVRLNFKFWSF